MQTQIHVIELYTVKSVFAATQKEDQNRFSIPIIVFNTDYRDRLMQVESIAECYAAKLWTFIKLQFPIKTFVLSICRWSLKTGFTVSIIKNKLTSFKVSKPDESSKIP